MRAFITFAAVAVALAAALRGGDACGGFPTCQTCVAHEYCGWCSINVTFPDGSTGPQCAGFDPNQPQPFVCNGEYSTEQCISGWECDLATFQCKLAPPGSGSTKQQCESNCTNNGQVYLCNKTTMQCYQVPRGTAHAESYALCEAACAHPSPHPAPPPPTETPAALFACNQTTGQCVPSVPGKGSSMEVCQQTCQKTDGKKYFCNLQMQKCEELPPGIPGGETKEECVEKCELHPNPGPPPAFLGGMWRGIEIQHGYVVGEWDMDFTQTEVTIIDVTGAVTIKGTPYNVQNGEQLDLWIKVTKGPGVGQYIKAIGVSAGRGPETNFLTAAFGSAGGAAPASISAAMNGGEFKVFFLAQCAGTPECVFHMPAGDWTLRGRKRVSEAVNAMKRQLLAEKQPQLDVAAADAAVKATNTDPCSQYSESCAECLSHQFCGWCSFPVTYKDGQKGTQCAGFNSDPNASNPFVCDGRYSTENCTLGYVCDEQTHQCKEDPTPGNGMPQTICTELCKPTPAPTPLPPQYVCNLTTHQCHKCEEAHCAGSMPEGACEAACKHPHKGPTSLVKGIWRGLKISQNYPLAEYEYAFNASSLTVYRNGQQEWDADVTSLGGDLMVLEVASGANAGKKLSAMYSIANQDGMYSAMTIAVGRPDGPAPTGYAGPMNAPPEYELVMAKCNSDPCVFNTP